MSWESEFETALRLALTGESTITSLLAAGAAGIIQGRPFRKAGYPQITISYRDESEQRISGYGKLEIPLQIDIWGALESLDAIREALHNVLDERTRLDTGKSASPITMTNWTCKHIRYLSAHLLSTGRFDAGADNTEVMQRVTEWSVKLYRT